MADSCKLLRSLETTHVDECETKLTGSFPEWLVGCLIRNGPGKFEFDTDKSYNHLLDGQACIHKFKITKTKVIYSNKFIDSKSFQKTSLEKKCYSSIGTPDTSSSIFTRLKHLFTPSKSSDNTNLNILPYANDHLYALSESNYMYRLDPFDLKVIQKVNVTDYLPTIRSTIANPHIEPDGTWYTIGINAKERSYEFIKYFNKEKRNLNVKVLNNLCENGEVLASIPSSFSFAMSYFHSFGMTENYMILLEQSLQISLKSLVKCAVLNRSLTDSVVTKPDQKTRIIIVDKRTGEICRKYFFTDPLITFNHINAFETHDPHFIFVDICAYEPKYFEVNDFKYKKLFSDTFLYSNSMKPTAKRIRIPFGIDLLSDEEIYCPIWDLQPEVFFEMPIINPKFKAKPYRYIYGVNYNVKPFSIMKLNLANPLEVFEWKYFENDNEEFLPSEPVFVESPNAKSEDDGVLLVMVLSEANDFLSVLDAKKMVEIAKAELPADVKAAFTMRGFFADWKNYAKMSF